jgi:methyl-accepting chemotaxis protein
MKQWKVKTHLLLLAGILLSSMTGIGALGLYGMRATVQGLETVYLDRVIPQQDLKKISELYSVQIVDAIHKARDGIHSGVEAAQQIRQAMLEIDPLWRTYLSTRLIDEEVRLINEITPLMQATEAPLQQLQAVLNRNDGSSQPLEDFAAHQLYPLIDPLTSLFSQLADAQLKEARQQFELSQALYEVNIRLMAGSWPSHCCVAAFMRCCSVPDWRDTWAPSPTNWPISAHGLPRACSAIRRSATRAPQVSCNRSRPCGAAGQHDRQGTRGLAAHRVLDSEPEHFGRARPEAGRRAKWRDLFHCRRGRADVSQHYAHRRKRRPGPRHHTKVEQITALGIASMDRSIIEMQQIAQLVTQTSSEIDQLTQHSNAIGNIVDVIHSIAEQTNLLALNAAIEAARPASRSRVCRGGRRGAGAGDPHDPLHRRDCGAGEHHSKRHAKSQQQHEHWPRAGASGSAIDRQRRRVDE